MARGGVKKAGPRSPAHPQPRKSMSAAEAHMLVATTDASFGKPPYVCVPAGGGVCLRYNLDPATGEYSIPPFGERMSCDECRGGR
jgi:hypothetical protein